MNNLFRTLVAAVALAPAACASTPSATSPSSSDSAKPSAADIPAGSPTDAKATRKTDPAATDAGFARTLIELDQRVDRYVYLSSQPGHDSRAERGLLGPALRAQVGQYAARLIAALGDADEPSARRVAAKALAFSDDPSAVPALVRVLSEKGDDRLLIGATYSLSQIRSPATPAEPLLALVQDPDPIVKGNALLALWHVFDAKRAVGASPLDPIARQQAVSILEPALYDGADAVIRANAAAALGALGDPRGVDPLINLLRDEHPLVRTQTAIALGKLGDVKAISALVTIIDATPIGTPRTAVVLALTTLVEKRGVTVPENLGESQRQWETFLQEKFGQVGKGK